MNDDFEFENEVRRIARLLWPTAQFGGAEIVENRERDGIFEDESFVHCIECTTSKSKGKAIQDGQKLDRLLRQIQVSKPLKFIKGWFITKNEPTADQRTVFKGYQGRIVACSYEVFRAQLIDACQYLSCRRNYAYGSVRDPLSNSTDYDLKYSPLDFLESSGNVLDAKSLTECLLSASRIVLTGDYGSGKSSTARQVFIHLANEFMEGRILAFPVMLNLRDHHGQTDCVEALERHARRIGFTSPPSLVRAWRAGFCILLLDGFDEVATAGWAGLIKQLRDLRYRSMELIRAFVAETPASVGILLTGRAHFFDTDREMSEALLRGSAFRRMTIAQMSATTAKEYLESMGWTEDVPNWLPTRPLLLAYLVGHELTSRKLLGDASLPPAQGWDFFLGRIAERESEIEPGLDPSTVRRLIEALASMARRTAGGLGPLSATTIIETFKQVCGYLPDDRGAVLLQRLPGLGSSQSEDGARAFIDPDFVEIACCGDVLRFVEDPFSTEVHPDDWQETVGELGASFLVLECKNRDWSIGKLTAAFVEALKLKGHTLAGDIFIAMIGSGGNYMQRQAFIKQVVFQYLEIEISGQNLSAIELQDCIISNLILERTKESPTCPRFVRCTVGLVDGCAGASDLPKEVFTDCEFESFGDSASTANSILALSLPLSAKVMLTILKKTYAQSGTGRQESALYRGLGTREKQVVGQVIDTLRRHGFLIKSKQGVDTIWLPSKEQEIRKRALAMLAQPLSVRDAAMDEVRAM